MNLSGLFKTQKALDDRIVKEKGREGQDLLPEKILALLTELGELSNEWRGFKFWSEDQEPRTKALRTPTMNYEDKEYYNPLLEEYVDCLHFILSIGLETDDIIFDLRDMEIYFEDIKEVGITEQFITTSWLVGCLFENKIHYEQALFNVLKLGEMLGFTWGQIEVAYFSKNKINHSRQESGY